jgi:SulP family sulfate permease
MQIGPHKFDRLEFAGSLGDLGTLLPLSVALMVINGLSVTPVLFMVGLFYIFSGLYFKLPIPVQPLKVVSAIAVAYPAKITVATIAASGIIMGLVLLLFAISGLMDWLAKFFTKPIVRGIQLGLGFILISKGISFVIRPELFIRGTGTAFDLFGISINPIIGAFGFILTLLLLSSKRFPSALVLVTLGVGIGILGGALRGVNPALGPTSVKLFLPHVDDFLNAFMLLVVPQIPLTLGNAVMGTADACQTLFAKDANTRKATYKAFASSMGLANLLTGLVGAMPMCHGAGGLAAHYRFGARSGGSNIMIGVLFLVIAIAFGKIGISLLSSIPNAILGVLLLFAGLELALLIKDVTGKNDLFLSFFIAGIGLATTNMGIAFILGIIIMRLIAWRNIKL